MRPLILVVDDEVDIRTVLGDFLADEGYRVVCARDGQEALGLMALELPGLVLSDVTMPRMDGVTLVSRIRAQGLTVPVVLISANYDAVDLPGAHFLRKPFDLDQITATVARCLGTGESIAVEMS